MATKYGTTLNILPYSLYQDTVAYLKESATIMINPTFGEIMDAIGKASFEANSSIYIFADKGQVLSLSPTALYTKIVELTGYRVDTFCHTLYLDSPADLQ